MSRLLSRRIKHKFSYTIDCPACCSLDRIDILNYKYKYADGNKNRYAKQGLTNMLFCQEFTNLRYIRKLLIYGIDHEGTDASEYLLDIMYSLVEYICEIEQIDLLYYLYKNKPDFMQNIRTRKLIKFLVNTYKNQRLSRILNVQSIIV